MYAMCVVTYISLLIHTTREVCYSIFWLLYAHRVLRTPGKVFYHVSGFMGILQ